MRSLAAMFHELAEYEPDPDMARLTRARGETLDKLAELFATEAEIIERMAKRHGELLAVARERTPTPGGTER